MASERVQRQINRLLDEAEEAIARSDWALVHDRTQNVLALAPENSDGLAYLAAAERALSSSSAPSSPPAPGFAAASPVSLTPATQVEPTSFANRRYEVKRFLGEGGKKKVYLAQDTLLDWEVAFALIKTEGLDEASRTRITREAQAMGRLGSHPHIVTVFDLGEHQPTASGPTHPYMVTELMGDATWGVR